MRDITVLMNRYRECACNLWNVYFSGKENYGASEDAFSDISRLLFNSLVVEELFYAEVEEGEEIPPPVLKVVPGTRSLILIERLSEPGEASYWDEVKDMCVGPDDIDLRFGEFFDFSNYPIKDFRYYMCQIVRFPGHPEYEGRRSLIETLDCRVFDEE